DWVRSRETPQGRTPPFSKARHLRVGNRQPGVCSMRKLIVGSSMLAGLVACTTPSGETTEVLGENSAAITVGTTYNLKLPQLTNSCLDVTGAGTGDGTNIEEWACGNAAANSFTVQNASVSGWYQLVNPNSGKCVDVAG